MVMGAISFFNNNDEWVLVRESGCLVCAFGMDDFVYVDEENWPFPPLKKSINHSHFYFTHIEFIQWSMNSVYPKLLKPKMRCYDSCVCTSS